MIQWLVQTSVDHPDLAAGQAPNGLLTPFEDKQYQNFLSPNRRRDWLLGRWTTKLLVQKHVAATHGFRPALDSFRVAQTPNGAPYIVSHHPALGGTIDDESEPARLPLAISISHSHGYAFCAASADAHGRTHLGADIELVETQPEGFAAKFFSAREQENINAAPPHMQTRLTVATWNAKEAVLKATHLGLRADLSGVECRVPPVRPQHWTPLHVEIDPATRAQSGIIGPLAVWWRVVNNRLLPGSEFVLTLAAFGARL